MADFVARLRAVPERIRAIAWAFASNDDRRAKVLRLADEAEAFADDAGDWQEIERAVHRSYDCGEGPPLREIVEIVMRSMERRRQGVRRG